MDSGTKKDIVGILKSGRAVQFMPQGISMRPLFADKRDYAIVAPVEADGHENRQQAEAKRGDKVLRRSRLKRGDAVLYRNRLKRGDVVLYRSRLYGNVLALHRIYRVRPDGFYLVGDSQTAIEGPVDAGEIYGIMTGVIRKGRKFSVKNPLYVLTSRLWLLMRPVRPFFMGRLIDYQNRKIEKKEQR